MDIITFINSLTNEDLNRIRNSKSDAEARRLLREHQALQLQQTGVSGSALPVGFKIYECTDCKEINVKKDNREIRVGFCDNCDHPLWNDDVN